MKKFKFALLLSLFVSIFTLDTHAANLCEVIRAAKSGEFTAQGLCEAYNVSFCSNLSMSGAICQIGGGSFCSSVKSDIQAVCEINRGSFCSSLSEPQRLQYFNFIQNCLNH